MPRVKHLNCLFKLKSVDWQYDVYHTHTHINSNYFFKYAIDATKMLIIIEIAPKNV